MEAADLCRGGRGFKALALLLLAGAPCTGPRFKCESVLAAISFVAEIEPTARFIVGEVGGSRAVILLAESVREGRVGPFSVEKPGSRRVKGVIGRERDIIVVR